MPRTKLRAAAVAALAAATLAGCGGSPVKAGSAAIVDDERITVSTLDRAVQEWQRQFPGNPLANEIMTRGGRIGPDTISEQRMRLALNTLVTLKVGQETARRAGVEITPGAIDRQLAGVEPSRAQAVALGNGLPVRYVRDLARYSAEQDALIRRGAGDADPQSPQAMAAAQDVQRRMQDTARSMRVTINPRFGGAFDPSQLTITQPRTRLSATETGIR
ncbi:hypothetical protein [Actinomadura flavalba]|uniref:hypothetical protein n=1 Tax=Actinomadura flavalba TaxID=1120938 RepID=UPI0003AA9B3E|nr:hypothetical protein [Actinomadura flavalba]